MIAVLLVPAFRLQAALRASPDLARCPVGLVADKKPHAPLVEVTRAARRWGIEPGLTPTQALTRCREFVVVQRDRAAEEAITGMLLARARQMAPVVEATEPGVVTLGVATLRQGKNWERWLWELLADLPSVTARAGLGRTPWLARLAAEEGRPYRVVWPGEEKAFLAGLPVERAEFDAERLEVLRLWGVRTLGEVAALGRAPLVARWGREGGELWDRATGRFERALVAMMEEERWVEGKELENPVETLEPLLFLLRRFLDLLLARLGERLQGVRQMRLKLAWEDGTERESVLDLPEPTRDGGRLFRVLQQHLEGIRAETRVVGVWLEAIPGEPPGRQPDFFAAGLRRDEGFRETLARLMALVGRERVGVPVVEETHEPDRFLVEARAPVPGGSRVDEAGPALVLRRFRPPVAAQVRLGQTGPVAFCGEVFAEEVIRARGPWRNSGGWWEENRAWEREEWDVETREGRLFRIVRCGTSWVVEGVYD